MQNLWTLDPHIFIGQSLRFSKRMNNLSSLSLEESELNIFKARIPAEKSCSEKFTAVKDELKRTIRVAVE